MKYVSKTAIWFINLLLVVDFMVMFPIGLFIIVWKTDFSSWPIQNCRYDIEKEISCSTSFPYKCEIKTQAENPTDKEMSYVLVRWPSPPQPLNLQTREKMERWLDAQNGTVECHVGYLINSEDRYLALTVDNNYKVGIVLIVLGSISIVTSLAVYVASYCNELMEPKELETISINE